MTVIFFAGEFLTNGLIEKLAIFHDRDNYEANELARAHVLFVLIIKTSTTKFHIVKYCFIQLILFHSQTYMLNM